MIFLAISFIFLICGVVLFYKSNQIKINRNLQQELYEKDLHNYIHQLEQKKDQLINAQIVKKDEINKQLLEWQQTRTNEIKKYLSTQQQLANQNVTIAKQTADKQIKNINNEIQKARESAQDEKIQLQKELDKLRASLTAGVEARLREQEKKDKIEFYKLSASNEDLSDIQMLENLKASFHKPVVLSKLIWSQYFQKQTTELCDRVLGKGIVCGIYKITNLITEQCYVGQSLNIAQRWKEHVKCGLGIQASATNTLYKSMQKDKIWNFTFELIQKCPKQQLNEKEKYWIQMYQSNKFGLNSNRGVGK